MFDSLVFKRKICYNNIYVFLYSLIARNFLFSTTIQKERNEAYE